MDREDAPTVETISVGTRLTRRVRKLGCGVVPAGTLYHRWVGKVDGEFTVWTECDACHYGYDHISPTVDRLRD